MTPPTASVEDAVSLAAQAHRGQRYPSLKNEPYIFHPLRMMMEFRDPVDVGLRDLVEAGFPDVVVAAVDSLTHRAGESYVDYIERLAPNDVDRRVKIVDLRHNLANNRRLFGEAKIVERIARYEKALTRLDRYQPA